MIFSVASEEAQAFRAGPFNEVAPSFSPDGRSLAYASDESGAFEVYGASFPGPGPECRVSVSGGNDPRWSANGELFYRANSSLMVVRMSDLEPICDPEPERLLDGLERISWDAAPARDFFITLEPRPEPKLFLTLNFFEELKRLVPN